MPARGLRHYQKPPPLHFPVSAEAPVSKRHHELRINLYTLAKSAFLDKALIGCNQFLYWNAADPSQSLAPDLFVRLGGRDTDFDSWKTWERGTPELGVEITSHSDSSELAWDRKLERYHAAGFVEVVRFDPDGD